MSSCLAEVQFLEEPSKVPQVRYGPLEMRQRRRRLLRCWAEMGVQSRQVVDRRRRCALPVLAFLEVSWGKV